MRLSWFLWATQKGVSFLAQGFLQWSADSRKGNSKQGKDTLKVPETGMSTWYMGTNKCSNEARRVARRWNQWLGRQGRRDDGNQQQTSSKRQLSR
jgi:hypothetical protein